MSHSWSYTSEPAMIIVILKVDMQIVNDRESFGTSVLCTLLDFLWTFPTVVFMCSIEI